MPKFTNYHYQLNLRLALFGFFVALFSAGIGLGGGALLVPILMSLFNFDFKKATSTSLSTIIPISLIGSVSHHVFLHGIEHLQYYFIFIPACVLGAIFAGRIVQKRPNSWLKLAFSLFLLIISLRMLKLFDLPSIVYSGLHDILFLNEWLLIVSIGILIGIIAMFLGIGCGLLIVPFFVIIINLNMHEAITLSLTTMFFLTLSATIIRKKLKLLDTIPLKSLFIPALIGAVVGAIISNHLPTLILKKLFGMSLFVIACYYLMHELAVRHKLSVSANNYKKWEKQKL
ncbi:MAG: sulfite exporter TauE/SafE family protein [Desulfobacteraceae bacterium]|nr:sulfite exporter TauE/SafE family protein [Desulfobacteraceae bacterium]